MAVPKAANLKSHKIRDGAVALYALGDSHLRESHEFPDAYAQARAAGRFDSRYSAINRMVGEQQRQSGPESGYHLTEEYLARVLGLMDENKGKAVAYFISIGTNDLRQAAAADRGKKVDELMSRFRTIMDKVAETPGAVLLILEPIPCNRGIQRFRDQLNIKLEAECQGREKVRFVALTHGSKPLIYKVNGLYHNRTLWADELHLNQRGAGLVVRALAGACNQFRSELFVVDPAAIEPRPAPGGAAPASRPPGNPGGRGLPGLHTTRGGKVDKGLGRGKRGDLRGSLSSERGRGTPRGSLFPVKSRLGPDPRVKGFNPTDAPTEFPSLDSGPPFEYYQGRREEAHAIHAAALAEINQAERERRPVREGTVVIATPTCRPHGQPGYWGPPPPPPPSSGPPPPPTNPGTHYYQDVM
jgi:lysophospholipase L1-like esterase